MNNIFLKTDIEGLLYRKLNPFYDYRGQFISLYNEHIVEGFNWVEDDVSISHMNVLRGFHLDHVATKLITPIFGDIFLAFVDKEYNAISFYCTNGQRYQFLVTPNIGIAHLVLSEIGILHYKQDTLYNINNQETIAWDDYRITNINFPISDPILSDRDASA
jgi:dTDP-4-dehydrorhamnose 3,5-epimerase